MKPSVIKSSISYFFIILFLSVKMIGLHALFHDTDQKNETECAVCIHSASHQQDFKFIADTLPELAFCTFNSFKTNVNIDIPESFHSANQVHYNFSRPPPFLI
ncbi:hypothetical protein D3C87_537550 [compost metagenome]